MEKSNESVKISIDQNKSLNYEIEKGFYLQRLTLMWILTIWVILKKAIFAIFGTKPKINTIWLDGLSLPCRRIKEGAGSWRALEAIYNYRFGQQNNIRGKITDYWLKILNAQAVRNRLRLVKQELLKAIKETAQKEKEVHLLSIASGSAQAIFESMLKAQKENIIVKTTLLDLDPTAIEYNKKAAKKYNLENNITFIVESTTNLEKATAGAKYHIIEMVGFLDYRPRHKAVRLISKINKLLLPEGRFITANMIPNHEQYFMKWVINWSMIYRRPKELGRLLTEGEFDAQKSEIICEPLGLHAVAVCKK